MSVGSLQLIPDNIQAVFDCPQRRDITQRTENIDNPVLFDGRQFKKAVGVFRYRA